MLLSSNSAMLHATVRHVPTIFIGGVIFSTRPAGTQRRLTFTVRISTPGEWRVGMRKFHDDPDHTESNDVWLQFDNNGWVRRQRLTTKAVGVVTAVTRICPRLHGVAHAEQTEIG